MSDTTRNPEKQVEEITEEISLEKPERVREPETMTE
jgi:hypothetical protein